MPKALWSADEKSLFFEALNEYGKDFDAITAYICAKMKKKGMSDGNLKTKTQVSHFYYRTWHKLSKYVRFDESMFHFINFIYIDYGLTSHCSRFCLRNFRFLKKRWQKKTSLAILDFQNFLYEVSLQLSH